MSLLWLPNETTDADGSQMNSKHDVESIWPFVIYIHCCIHLVACARGWKINIFITQCGNLYARPSKYYTLVRSPTWVQCNRKVNYIVSLWCIRRMWGPHAVDFVVGHKSHILRFSLIQIKKNDARMIHSIMTERCNDHDNAKSKFTSKHSNEKAVTLI